MKEAGLPDLLAKLKNSEKLDGFASMPRGHMNVPLYSCTRDGFPLVVKIGLGDSAKTEVLDNIIGYEKMVEEGGQELVPGQLRILEIDGSPIIVMENLNNSFSQDTKVSSSDFYVNFYSTLALTMVPTFKVDHVPDNTGIQEFKVQILKWVDSLVSKELLTRKDYENLDALDCTKFIGKKSSLMLLDFTPDNVFFRHNKISFIDPWRQSTYRGPLIPSLSQFQTLTQEVYALPGSKETQKAYLQLINDLGNEMELSSDQIEKQMLMGRSLQYALSAFVRIESLPEVATKYAQVVKSLVERMYDS